MRSKRILATSLAAAMAITAFAAPAALGKGRPLKAELTGAAEVPVLGDPDGTGYAHFRLNQGKRRICYTIQVNDIAPATAAHIHEGEAGVAGDIAVFLTAPDETGFVKDCVHDVERSLIKAIRKQPALYYVNVHNDEFTGGALRGQLEKRAPGRDRKR